MPAEGVERPTVPVFRLGQSIASAATTMGNVVLGTVAAEHGAPAVISR